MKFDDENIIRGIAAAPGIAIARAYVYNKEIEAVNDGEIKDVDEAIESLMEALEKSKKELLKVFSLAVDKLGRERAAIFEAQIMILDDPVLVDTLKSRIRKEKKNPEYIVDDEISKYQKMMADSREPYMKERSQDIEDIKHRIVRNIKKKKWKSRITEDVIVVAPYLTPADTVLFTRVDVNGFVTNFGGLTSHAAIISRSLHLPAAVGLHEATERIKDGDLLILDGFHGEVFINPGAEQLEYFRRKKERLIEYDAELAKLKEEPAITMDGVKIKLMANLDLNEEISLAKENGAEGAGLVRTEQLLEEYDTFPGEEIQVGLYTELAEAMKTDTVIIRALDVGGDKVLPVDVKEPNPFLGWRGVRFLLDNPELTKNQIRAVLRSAVNGNIKFMIPMVSSIQEIRKFRALVEQCKTELKEKGIRYRADVKIGIMIEVPSAAVMAGEFAEEADFISIGTNDLIQYLLAVDRGNEIVSDQYQEFHPAIVRTLHYIIKASADKNCHVGICGEMAADPMAVPLLIGLGLDSLSVGPSSIPNIKKIIRSINYGDAVQLAERCLKLKTEKEIRKEITVFYENKAADTIKEIFEEEY